MQSISYQRSDLDQEDDPRPWHFADGLETQTVNRWARQAECQPTAKASRCTRPQACYPPAQDRKSARRGQIRINRRFFVALLQTVQDNLNGEQINTTQKCS